MSDADSIELFEANRSSHFIDTGPLTAENPVVDAPDVAEGLRNEANLGKELDSTLTTVQWVRKYVHFDHGSGVTICTNCGICVAFRSFSAFRGHLKEKHGFTVPLANEFINQILCNAGLVSGALLSSRTESGSSRSVRVQVLLPRDELPKSLEGTFLTPEQKLYWFAPESLEKKWGALAAIPFLPVENGLQCPAEDCLYCCKSKETMRAHYYRTHNGDGTSIHVIGHSTPVTIQTINKAGAKCKYFPVHLTGKEQGSVLEMDIDLCEPVRAQLPCSAVGDDSIVANSGLSNAKRNSSEGGGTNTNFYDGINLGGLEEFVALGTKSHALCDDEYTDGGTNDCLKDDAQAGPDSQPVGPSRIPHLARNGKHVAAAQAQSERQEASGQSNGSHKAAPHRVRFAEPLSTLLCSIPDDVDELQVVSSDLVEGTRRAGKDNGTTCFREQSAICDIGDFVWDSIKTFNPAFKGYTARQIASGKNNSTFPNHSTVSDDQLLGCGDESARRGADMFEFLCNFRDLLNYLGYNSLQSVPLELVSLLLKHPKPKKSKDTILSEDDNEEDGEMCVAKNRMECNNEKGGQKDTLFGTSEEIANDFLEGFAPANHDDMNMASTLLENLEFDDRSVIDHIHRYLRNCRDATYQCAEPIRRLVYTRDYSNYFSGCDVLSTTRAMGSSRSVIETFKPSTNDQTLKRYATETACLVLFIVKTVMLKMLYQTSYLQKLFDTMFAKLNASSAGNNSTSPDSGGEGHSLSDAERSLGRGLEALQRSLRKNKLSVLGQGALTVRYKTLLTLLPDDIAREAILYMLHATNYCHVAEKDVEMEKQSPVWEETQRSLHRLLRSALTQKVTETASTAGLFLRHFIAIMSVWHKKPRTGCTKPSSREVADQISRAAAITSFEPGDRNCASSTGKDADADESPTVGERGHQEGPESEAEEPDPELFRIKRACEISSLFAALLYTCSSCGIWEAMNVDGVTRIMIDQELRMSFSLDVNNAVSLLRGFMGKAMHVLQNTDGGLNFVRCSRPGVEHAECAWVDTIECSLPMLRSAIVKWQQELRTIIHDRLLLGMKLPAGFWSHLSTLQDHFKMDTRGFNVFSRQIHETFSFQCGRMIAEHIASDQALLYKFFTKKGTAAQSSEGQQTNAGTSRPTVEEKNDEGINGFAIRGEAPAVHAYLNDCRAALDIAIVLAHTTGGAPARGTELASFLLEDTADSVRNFYVFQGQVIMWATHNKMRSLSAGNRSVARFLDMESSQLWLLLIAVVRPFEIALVQAKHGAEAAQRQSVNLFAYRGKRYTDVQVRRSITKKLQSKKIFFKFSQYRHWQCGIIRMVVSSKTKLGTNPVLLQGWGPQRGYSYGVVNLDQSRDEGNIVGCRGDSRGVIERPEDPMDHQAGHSAGTADRNYAQSSDSFRGIPTSRMMAFQKASRNWHTLLQLDSDWKIPNPSLKLPGQSQLSILSEPSKPGFNISEERVSGVRTSRKRSRDCFTPVPVAAPEILKPIRSSESLLDTDGSCREPAERIRKLDYALTSLEHTTHARLFSNSGIPQAPIIPLKCRKEILQGLRAVLRQPNAAFSCNIQEEAIYGAIQRQRDMIVVMGTGAGKSAIFQTVALLEGQAAAIDEKKPPVTIVVVPLVALVSDHLRECADIPGLVAGRWPDRNSSTIQILFVSVEHTIGLEFKRLLIKLANEHRLTRIVVDECHLTLLWCSFRPSMLQLGFSIQHRSLRIQRILLSATVPPQQVEETAQVHGLVRGYSVLRQPSTSRQNLSYRVQTCEIPPPRFKHQEAAMIESTQCEIRNELFRIANDISRHHSAYMKDNRADINMRNDESGAFYQVSKQQVVIYVPFKYMVGMTCGKLADGRIHCEEFLSSETTSDADDNGEFPYLHVIAVVCDVMSYHVKLKSTVKELVHKKWMKNAEELHKSQSKQAQARFHSLAEERCSQERGKRGFPTEGNGRRPVVIIALVQVMVSTCAFGTGINSPHVRAVLHIGGSRSLMEYAQESGRAGRDGLPARCIVVYNNKFAERIGDLMTKNVPDSVLLFDDSSKPPDQPTGGSSSTTSFSMSSYARQGEQAFAQHIVWLETSAQCRRTSLSQHIDDFPGSACIHDVKTMSLSPCDFCYSLLSNETMNQIQDANDGGGVSVPIGGRSMVVRGAVAQSSDAESTGNSHLGSPARLPTNIPEGQTDLSNDCDKGTEDDEAGITPQRKGGEIRHQAGSGACPIPSAAHVNAVDGEGEDVLSIIRRASALEGESNAVSIAEEDQKQHFEEFEEMLTEFREQVDMVLLGKCVYCIATKGNVHEVTDETAERCPTNGKACFRCFRRSCRSGKCSVFGVLMPLKNRPAQNKKSGPKPCTSCGFLYFHGKFFHSWNRFGPNCQYRGALQVCLGAWYLPPTRKMIVEKFHLNEDWSTPKEIHIHSFFQWLRQMDDDNKRYNFMNVFGMITKSVSS